MPLLEEDAAALRADLEKLQREVGAAEAANREYEAKLERLRKERSLGTSFDGQGGGGLANRRGTATTTMGSMWTRGVRAGGGLRQGFFLSFSEYCTKVPCGMPSLRLHRLGAMFWVFYSQPGSGSHYLP